MRRHFTTSKMCLSDHYAGFQSFFRVLTQMSPDGVATLGWKIFVRKNPFGGFAGKPDSRTSLHLNTPP